MQNFRRALFLGTIGSASIGLWFWHRQTAPFHATVSPQKQQTIKGWGCYPATFQPDRPDAENYQIFHRPNAQKLILGELGISFMRCNILPHSYDAAKNDGSLNANYLDQTLVRQLKMAQKFGIRKYLLTVWSPPTAFKTPPITLGRDKTGRVSRLRPEKEATYCAYVVAVLDYLTKVQKLPKPMAYSIQNEPDFAPDLWDGTQYTAKQWRRVVVQMRRALDKNGYRDVPLIGPECGS